MKHEDFTANSVAVQELLPYELFKEMSEWSNRITKRAYELFAASGFANGHDRDVAVVKKLAFAAAE